MSQSEIEVKKEEIIEAEQKVLFPETHIDIINFLGKDVQLRPLPISTSKKLHSTFKPIQKKMSDLNRRTQSAIVEKKGEDGVLTKEIDYQKLSTLMKDEDVEMDMEIAQSILECVFILCSFYKLGFSKEYIDEESSLPDANAFLEAQFKIQGENDFLLRPLAGTMNLLKQM
jgi:hypothetical protein